jgi:hypothetical protein
MFCYVYKSGAPLSRVSFARSSLPTIVLASASQSGLKLGAARGLSASAARFSARPGKPLHLSPGDKKKAGG